MKITFIKEVYNGYCAMIKIPQRYNKEAKNIRKLMKRLAKLNYNLNNGGLTI